VAAQLSLVRSGDGEKEALEELERLATDPRGDVWLGSAGELPSVWQGTAWPTWSYIAVPVLVAGAMARALRTRTRRRRRTAITSDEKAA
jgi:hypothetical protein